MRRIFAVVGFVALSACSIEMPDFRSGSTIASAPPAPVEPVAAPVVRPQSAKDRFLASAAQNGCVVNNATSGAILASATLSREDLARIMTELRADGQGEIASDGASFRVNAGACA